MSTSGFFILPQRLILWIKYWLLIAGNNYTFVHYPLPLTFHTKVKVPKTFSTSPPIDQNYHTQNCLFMCRGKDRGKNFAVLWGRMVLLRFRNYVKYKEAAL